MHTHDVCYQTRKILFNGKTSIPNILCSYLFTLYLFDSNLELYNKKQFGPSIFNTKEMPQVHPK